MNAKAFLDTNVFIYFYSDNELSKRTAAHQALDSYTCITSIQAMNEACNVWYKKFRWGGEKIKEHLSNIELVCDDVVSIQKATIMKAISLKERYGYSYYDCLMLASALEGNCEVIFTEDMSDNQIIEDRLQIINPFKKQQ